MPASAPAPAVVLALYREGVDAVARLAVQVAAADAWDRTACGMWTAADVTRHVLDVIGWYHGWLDRALAGDPSPAFDIDDLDERTESGVRALAHISPTDAVTTFVSDAMRYADRIERHWDLPFGYPRGTVTAGLHAGLAAAEWHLHAWDVARALDRDHRPSDPGGLLTAIVACRAVAPGGIRRKAERVVAPVAARVRPWEAILAGSGRSPSG